MSNNSTGNSVGLIGLGLSLAVGMIIAAFILSGTLEKIKAGEQSISVKGYAEKNIKADLGVWRAFISVRSYDLVSGYSKLQTDVDVLLKYLESKSIDKNSIKLGSISNYRNYRYSSDGRSTGEVAGYSLERNVSVTSNDVNLIEQLASESTSLIEKGVEINSSSPEYFYTKLNDLKVEMLGKATKDAKERAEVIAKSSGNEVGSIKSATQGVFQITSRNSAEISDYGEYNLYSIDKTIKAVVTVSFIVK